MYKLVLLRHGESTWNKENRFTGWTDVPLSEKGKSEAKHAGRVLKEEGYVFDVAYTSVLKRAIDTLHIVLKEMGQQPTTILSWKLNERHYGALQGLNKSETAQKYGEDQVKIWRRSYDVQPPALDPKDKRHPSHDVLFKDIPKRSLPSTECLKDVVERVVPYWNSDIALTIKAGKSVIVAAHGNSLRALVKFLDDVPEEDIVELNIPTGVPLIYELNNKLKPIKHYYLGDPEEVKKAMENVASQGKAK